jgi:hypothetical protein
MRRKKSLPLEEEGCEKIEWRLAKTFVVARGREKFTVPKLGGICMAVKHFPDLRGATPAPENALFNANG